MTKYYARLIDTVVVEIIQIPDNASIADRFTSDLVATMVQGNNATTVGMTYDGSFHAPVTPDPTPNELLASHLAAGIDIVSTGTPALDATYAIDMATLQQITGLIALIGIGAGLPQGDPTVPWPDITGVPHNFTSVAFKDFAAAVSDYIFALRQTWGLLSQSQSANWPSLPVTIA